MRNLKFLSILLAVLFFLSCKGEDGKDGNSGNNGGDATADVIVRYNLSGKFQKGPCFKDGEVLIQPIDSLTMNQTGKHYIGFTKDDFGSYDIPAEVTTQYVEVFFEGTCDDEVTGGSGKQRLSGIIDASNDTNNNITPLTKIRSQVARELFKDKFGDIDQVLAEAEKRTLAYLGMPTLPKRFTEMNLETSGTSDAVLALANSMILYGKNEVEQGDYIISIANGVINNNLVLKSEIANTINVLPLVQIKKNLEARYSALGRNINMPPIWNLGAPAYYADLLERTPIVQSTFNLADTGTCSFDQSAFNTFAIPHVFSSGIEASKYIALNLDKDISIWTRGFDVYDRPGTKVLDITTLKEIILEDPAKLSYNGLLGDVHGLAGGTDYYIVIRSDTDFTLSTSCEGGLLPFGRKLASDDEGLNWIGHNNSTPWFRKSGVKMFTTD